MDREETLEILDRALSEIEQALETCSEDLPASIGKAYRALACAVADYEQGEQV